MLWHQAFTSSKSSCDFSVSLCGSAAGTPHPLQWPSAALKLTKVSSPLVLVPAAALPWNPVGFWMWQQSCSCWLQRSEAQRRLLLALAFAVLEAGCVVGAHASQQEQLSLFWGSCSAQAGAALPAACPHAG